jgi:hypothetical protein
VVFVQLGLACTSPGMEEQVLEPCLVCRVPEPEGVHMELLLTEYGAKLGKRGECLVVKRAKGPDVEVVAEDVTSVAGLW